MDPSAAVAGAAEQARMLDAGSCTATLFNLRAQTETARPLAARRPTLS